MQNGWIKLHRCVMENWMYQVPREYSKFEAWIDMLMEVRWNPEPDKVLIGNTLHTVGIGQSIKSINTWATRWGWSESKVRRFFKLLESDEAIVTESTNKTTKLTIVNYESYQLERRTNDEQVTNKRRTSDEQTATEEEGNKGKKVNKEKQQGFDSFWNAWPKHPRKAAKKQCMDKWVSHDCSESVDKILAALEQFKDSHDWKKNDGQFIPAPLVWLNQERWDAEIASGGDSGGGWRPGL